MKCICANCGKTVEFLEDSIHCEECLQREIADMPRESEKRACSFCGKSQEQVEQLVAGPKVYICNECVDHALEIIAEQEADDYWKNVAREIDEQKLLGPC